MQPLTAGRFLIHLALSLGAGAALAFIETHGMADLLGSPSLGWTLWLVLMPLGWIQCLISLQGLTALVGGRRPPGVFIVLGGALLVSLPLTLEIRILIGLLDPITPFTDPLEQTFGMSLAVCLVFSAIAWGVIERRPFSPPPCSWTMMGAGGPGADLDMDAALERLKHHLNRKRAKSPAPALPFHPPTIQEKSPPPSPPTESGTGAAPEEAFDAHDSPPTTSSKPSAELRLARMPEGLEGTILCIEMQDHYLRIHTNRGQGTILGRLRDAERELGESGMKVHRSWWVARSAITGSTREGRNLTLTLTNGQRVPVSRGNQPMITEAGWLED
ncbi:LytTR family DNA-binding domain-containing protein [Rhodospirillum sp. A1_3_36]|uniref:LytTR family DNA-binding domain-containing protein n=1 Tax=Rhodospirillum sp. A1_3_36 TaxID=3391666 RepID=UPI0039A61B54